jgi:hypothetical protein
MLVTDKMNVLFIVVSKKLDGDSYPYKHYEFCVMIKNGCFYFEREKNGPYNNKIINVSKVTK